MSNREVMQQALEALCSAVEPKNGKVYARGFEPIDCYAMHEQAIAALRTALEQEHAMHDLARLGQEIEQGKRGSIALARSLCYQVNGAADDSDDMDGGGYGSVDIAEILSAEVVRLQKALAQPEQVDCPRCGHVCSQRLWVGLTPEEILDLFDINNVYGSKWIEFARSVETKLKAKNDH